MDPGAGHIPVQEALRIVYLSFDSCYAKEQYLRHKETCFSVLGSKSISGRNK